jgi:Tol biopolymer transport system component
MSVGELDQPYAALLRRRDRKRRNQRISAGVVGIAVFVAAIWIVTSVGSLDRSETSVVPGGDVTGPAETGPAETGPAQSGPTETGPSETRQGIADLPVSVTDYLVDLETGARTPLPESIVGMYDVTSDYAVSPDGSRLAFTGPIGKGRGKAIFVANLDGTGVEQVTSVDAGVLERPAGGGDPAWSPDGSRIAYVGGRGGWWGNVFVVDLATGATTQVTDEPDGGGTSTPSFTPDGESIVYSSEHEVSEVRIVPITGGRSVRLVGGDGTNAQDPALSPDGSLLYYSCWDRSWGNGGLCLANADGTDARVLVGGGLLGDLAGSWSPDGTRIAYGTWPPHSINVVDVATGEVTTVAEGAFPTWLDGHTLIVEADGCSLPPVRQCPF